MQVDFAIIRLLADLLVTGYSTVWFIQGKRVVPANLHHHGSEEQLLHHTSSYEEEDEEEGMMKTVVTFVPAAAAAAAAKISTLPASDVIGAEEKQLHPRLPSQTTAAQRAEDTRP